MEYIKTMPFEGDGESAIKIARSIFANNNFIIESLSNLEIVAKGPGMQSTKQNPLLGASRVRIAIESSFITLSAELGGVKWMRNFLFVFPPSLALLLSITFFILPIASFAAFIPWLAVLPWVFLSPLVARWIKKRTLSALDTMLHNMTVTSQTTGPRGK